MDHHCGRLGSATPSTSNPHNPLSVLELNIDVLPSPTDTSTHATVSPVESHASSSRLLGPPQDKENTIYSPALTEVTHQPSEIFSLWDETSPGPYDILRGASHELLLQNALYKHILKKNKELTDTNAGLQRVVGELQGKVEANRDAYNSLLRAVPALLRAPTADPFRHATVDPRADPYANPLSAPAAPPEEKQENNPKTRFWEKDTYAPYAQGQPLYGFRNDSDGVPIYLEDREGNPVTKARMAEMSEGQRKIWQELLIHGLAPLKWSKRSYDADVYHRSIMYSDFFEFRLSDGHKLTRFAGAHYPGWFRTNKKEILATIKARKGGAQPNHAMKDGDDDDDDDDGAEDEDDEPASPRKRSRTVPSVERVARQHSVKRAKSSAPAAPSRSILRLDESESDDDIPDVPSTLTVRRSASLNTPGPNHTAQRIAILTDPVRKGQILQKMQAAQAAGPGRSTVTMPPPLPEVPCATATATASTSAAAQSAANDAAAPNAAALPPASVWRLNKKSFTARNLAGAVYRKSNPRATANEWAAKYAEMDAEGLVLAEARLLFALDHLKAHPDANVYDVVDAFDHLASDENLKYRELATTKIAEERLQPGMPSRGRKGKGKATATT